MPRDKVRTFVKSLPIGLLIESDAAGDSTTILARHLDRITAVSIEGMEDDDHSLVIHTTGKDIEITYYSRTNLRQAHEQLLKALQK